MSIKLVLNGNINKDIISKVARFQTGWEPIYSGWVEEDPTPSRIVDIHEEEGCLPLILHCPAKKDEMIIIAEVSGLSNLETFGVDRLWPVKNGLMVARLSHPDGCIVGNDQFGNFIIDWLHGRQFFALSTDFTSWRPQLEDAKKAKELFEERRKQLARKMRELAQAEFLESKRLTSVKLKKSGKLDECLASLKESAIEVVKKGIGIHPVVSLDDSTFTLQLKFSYTEGNVKLAGWLMSIIQEEAEELFERRKELPIKLAKRKASSLGFPKLKWRSYRYDDRHPGPVCVEDTWVINPDGSLVDPSPYRDKKYQVFPGQLVLHFKSTERPALNLYAKRRRFEVKYRPEYITQEQRKTVAKIEREGIYSFGVPPNSFGLNPSLQPELEERVRQIGEAINELPKCYRPKKWSYDQLATTSRGVPLKVGKQKIELTGRGKLVHETIYHTLVESRPVAGGVLMVLADYKYGEGYVLGLVWRPLES